MASVNKVILVGNLGADPETRFLPSGDAVSNLRIATTDRYKDKSTNEWKESTEWHRVTFFGRLAEICNEFLKKGASIYVEGRIKTRKWQDQSGQDRYATDIIGDNMQMLGTRSQVSSKSTENQHSNQMGVEKNTKKTENNMNFDTIDDDIPF